tara:strand:- start:268 stop:516 length:249 start_codon:yes stop_codon:yes gene_type:complete
MKSKKNKLSNKERDDQLNYLFKSVYELSQELRMTRSLFENYIIWKKDVKKFTKHLQYEEAKRKSEKRQAEQTEGSGTSETVS